ncbi:hypothetical protein B7494_g8243 [Chlorociboria aeruginascens]|nr:hypothetical protein B7494_g8243 [Chlorociboria aeruginascens]
MPRPLEEDLLRSFSSIETLRREMIITANAMFGPGFVWLVRSRDHKYSILSTYIAGSPYPGAHYRRQPVDMNTEAKNVTDVLRNVIRDSPVNNVGAFGSLSEPRNQFAPGGIDINPVLCINVWEHVYLPDYGVGGKLEYAVNWWQTINWSEVANRAGIQPNQKYVT